MWADLIQDPAVGQAWWSSQDVAYAQFACLFADQPAMIESVTPAMINFMTRHTPGYLCVTLTAADCDRLELHPQTPTNTALRGTAMAVSVDGHGRHGVGTGISASDRARTARLLAEPLRDHRLTTRDLAAVRRRRNLPTVVTQTVQRFLHRTVIAAVLRGTELKPAPALAHTVAALFDWMPWLSVIPAYLIGVGLRPEHAPEFARRVPKPG